MPSLSVVSLSTKHRRTLEAVFARPVPASLEWERIEALFRAIPGALVEEAAGSRVRVALPDAANPEQRAVATFHRPHPAKEAKPYQVREARDLLARVGLAP